MDVVNSVSMQSKDLTAALAMDSLLPLIDLLGKSYSVVAAKQVLAAFSKQSSNSGSGGSGSNTTSDAVIIHTLFDLVRGASAHVTFV
jgi:hypothetical protein